MTHRHTAPSISRRRFIGDTTKLGLGGIIAFGAAPQFLGADTRGANERLTLGYIGVGGMGGGHLARGIQMRNAGALNVAAVCEVDSHRLAAARAQVGEACKAYVDYRELLEQKDIDAVIISTPDHWHAMQTVDACHAGKHVYVEKPSNCTVAAGRAMVEAARSNARVVQVGSQGRSGGPAHQVANYVRNGMIGKVDKVYCWHVPNPSGGPRRTSEPPAELDWDGWLGPLGMRPYVGGAYHPTAFRWVMESGGGNIRDRGVHVFSTAFWVVGADGQMPVSVEATGDPRPVNAVWDIPANMKVVYTFKNPDWELVWDQPGTPPEDEAPTHHHGSSFGAVFHGDKDNVVLFDSGWFSAAPQKVRDYVVPSGGVNLYRMDQHGGDVNMNHMADWLDAIKTGRKPSMDIEIAHHMAALAYLGNMAYVAGRKLEWDPARESFVDERVDQTLIWKSLRLPYI